ncbi:MAG: NAD-dependent epimerase/dehydratase family protein [Deltaproteobacteria bacterium]|nr:NAD-dependent epimerase/dehydratase family protein [Deltaproteobacteria bacterium]
MRRDIHFLTGANGFVGAALARELARRSEQVVLMVHQRQDHPFLRALSVPIVRGDLRDLSALRRLIPQGAVVIHCAARVSFDPADRPEVFETNVDGTSRLVDAAIEARARSMVFLSAGAVFGAADTAATLMNEDSPRRHAPSDSYAASKARAEQVCRSALDRGLDVRIANPVTTYGAGDHHLRAGGRVVHEVLSRKRLLVPPGGTSWIHIDDLVRGILLIAERGTAGTNYLLSAGHVSYRDLFEAITTAGGWRGTRIVLPPHVAPVARRCLALVGQLAGLAHVDLPVQRIAELFRYKYFSAARARVDLGFQPTESLETSVRATLEYLRAERLLVHP